MPADACASLPAAPTGAWRSTSRTRRRARNHHAAGGRMSRILIVEDEPKLASLVADYLKAAGYEAHCIENGLEVVSWVKSNQPDLIVLDLMLPGRSGLDICKEVRTFSDLPIIMVTARVEEVDRLIGLEAGADDYLCKPFSV